MLSCATIIPEPLPLASCLYVLPNTSVEVSVVFTSIATIDGSTFSEMPETPSELLVFVDVDESVVVLSILFVVELVLSTADLFKYLFEI